MERRGRKTKEVLLRILDRLDDVTDTGCWLFNGALDRDGYSHIGTLDGHWRKAHRVIYEILVAPIPPQFEIDHLCMARNCINPENLEPVTKEENIRWSSFHGAAAVARERSNYFKQGP